MHSSVCSVSSFTATMDKSQNRKAYKPKKRRNMEAQRKKGQEVRDAVDFGCQVESTVQEDKLTELRKANALLRDQLTDSQFKEHLSDCRLAAARESIATLKAQLEETRRDLADSENKVAGLSLKMDMAKQALKRRSACRSTQVDREQQTDQPDQTEDRQGADAAVPEPQLQRQQDLGEEAAENQKEKEVLLCEIQQLKEKLGAEEALRVKNETVALELKGELHKKNSAVEEAELKVGQLEKDLLKMKEEAREETEKAKASYIVQLEHLKKVNAEVTAAREKVEEQLQVHLKQWQEERASLQRATEGLQQTLTQKQQQWSERESDLGSRMDDIESKMKEMLDKKLKKKRFWLARFFTCSGPK